MDFKLHSLALIPLVLLNCSNQKNIQQTSERHGLSVIAIGDAGAKGSILRGNATIINNMSSGRHDAPPPNAMIFLGDNFYPIGLNIPADEVHSTVHAILGPYRRTFETLGRQNVHAIAGNHDYYARNVIDKSLLFGLVNIVAGPIGIAGRGNEREKAIEWWTYHFKMPAEVTYPTRPGARDSVQFIFYDSALPLRTDPETWTPALDSLRKLFRLSAQRNGIVWRVLAQHHPWVSVGEHAGYSVWDDVEHSMAYLSNCDKDSNVVSWFMNSVDPEDLCAEKYRAMLDSLRAAIHETGVKIHFTLAGHEHSLQLLSPAQPDHVCKFCPSVHVISGAGAKTTKAKLPAPPHEFTASRKAKQGESYGGFAYLLFSSDNVRITFYESDDGTPIDMGGGRTEFIISRDGTLK